ncbi:dicarboxylate/amino acid:cation symporter [Niveibacterium terrae]|uniref:dicarboxylate/amino acid:cation symporter n=1 Tax=Niveibacterium terrae TaxID=3373598 RepID=UPI003A8DF52F
MKANSPTRNILIAMILGLAVGYVCHLNYPDPDAAKHVAGYFSLLADIFLRLVKMIIAPLVFATVVSGVTGLGDAKAVGRIGLKGFVWFIVASLISLLLGMVMAGLLQPGSGLHLALPQADATLDLKTSAMNLKDFVTQVFPKSFFEAMANNSILQILVFALFLGFALVSLKERTANTIIQLIDEMVPVMLRVTDYVMSLAPVGIFGAIAAVITTQGLGVLTTYGKFLGGYYVCLVLLWAILAGAAFVMLGSRTLRLLKLLRDPILLAFSTASSEAAFPRVMENMRRFGVPDKITGFLLPLGYSFNLDGSMIYQAFASLFIAQIYGINLSLTQQITMLLVMMLSSKGIAGVPRASLVVVAAVLPMFGLPEAGLLLIMGIDQFLDMGRSATNVLGVSIATAAVAKMEGAIEEEAPEEAAA